jgi:hypothetical protein
LSAYRRPHPFISNCKLTAVLWISVDKLFFGLWEKATPSDQ